MYRHIEKDEKKLTYEEIVKYIEKLQKQVKEYQDKIEQKTCKNIAEMHPTDGFTCSECGVTVIDFREERVDEEDCTASWYEYKMKYCPNCGAKVVQNG